MPKVKKYETFGRLLRGMLATVAAAENRTAEALEEEIAGSIYVAATTMRNYKSGMSLPQSTAIRRLAQIAHERAYLNREWVRRFLVAAQYHHIDALLQELFPESAPDSAPPRVLHNLPAAPFNQFVMRAQPYTALCAALQQRAAVVLLVGMGGMGKTSLAYELASRCVHASDDTPHFHAVVWVSDRDQPGTTTLTHVLNEIARTLDHPGYLQLAAPEKQRKIEDLLRIPPGVLVVVDNLETVVDPALLDWLIRLPWPSKALVTSRERIAVLRNNTWEVELRGLTESEAHELIRQRLHMLRMEPLAADLSQVTPLVLATGGCPLALEMALGVIKWERRAIQQVVDDMAAARGDLFDQLFSRAWALLDEASRRVLLALPLFHTSIAGEALATSADVTGLAFERALDRLTELALLEIERADWNSPPRYRVHPFVRAFAQAKLAEQGEFACGARERWLRWYLRLAGQVGFTHDDMARLEWLDVEEPTLFAAIQWAAAHNNAPAVIQLVNGAEFYYYVRAEWQKKLELHKLQTNAARSLGDVTEELSALAFQAQLFCRQGQPEAAEPYLQQLQAVSRQHPLQGDAFFLFHHTYGLYYLATGDHPAARQCWETILQQPQGLAHHMIMGAQHWLATCHYEAGDYRQARERYQQALAGAYATNAERMIARRQLDLAMIDLEQGDQASAAVRLAESRMRTRRDDREQHARLLRVQARLDLCQGNTVAAAAALREAIDLFERMGRVKELQEARAVLATLAPR